MLSGLRSRLSYANVVATLALFVALGGSSYAITKITGRNVPKDALTGADIKNLTGKDVTNESLTGADVKNLASGDVTNGALRAEDFAPGQLPKGDSGPQGLPGPTFATFTGSVNPDPTPGFLANSGDHPLLTTSFTTPSAGHVMVIADYAALTFNCDPVSVAQVGLYVDGVAVPATGRWFGDEAAAPLHVTGVTTDTLPAGPHVLAIGATCPDGNLLSILPPVGHSLGAVLLG